ncbi:unnamed protein product [Larinioides sclopetarius]|uniref:Oxidation resistance protein 1 n=1 Tax=Larinioides sclopetarius TaxID=280406 RepID=A0AAV2BD34_9ARAC
MLRVLMNACSRGCFPNLGRVNHGGSYHPVTLTMQVLSLGEMEKINYSELELPLPDLLSPSEILQEEHIKELYTLLPARAVGFPWTRIYSTSTDGFLLKTLYRKMTDFDCPVILIMQDTENATTFSRYSVPCCPNPSNKATDSTERERPFSSHSTRPSRYSSGPEVTTSS